MDKQGLRQRMLRLRASLPPEAVSHQARKAREHLFAAAVWKKAPAIASFISFGGEFPTPPVIKEAWRQGKLVAAPRVLDKKKRLMDFFPLRSWQDLAPGPLGISEPRGDKPASLAEDTLLLVPGLAFDRQGWRLGYGGGFYDVWLSHAAVRPVALGLAFSGQIVAAVPHDDFDQPLDGVISASGILWAEHDPV